MNKTFTQPLPLLPSTHMGNTRLKPSNKTMAYSADVFINSFNTLCGMKKNFLFSFFMAFCLGLMSNVIIAQTVSTPLSSGFSTSATFVGNSNYNVSEAIFLDSEIGSSNFITSATAIRKIGFNRTYNPNITTSQLSVDIPNYSIYMKNVSAATTTLNTGTYSLSGYTLVYSGNLVSSNILGWNTITLNTPFTRTAGSNLQVLVIRNSNSTHNVIVNTTLGNAVGGTSALTSRLYNGTTAPTENSTSLTATSSRFAIQLFAPFGNDAAVSGFTNLPAAACFSTGQSISVVLRNAGLNTIPIGAASVTLTVSSPNSSTATLTNTTALTYEDTQTLTFTNVNLNNVGGNQLNATVTLTGDENATNNSPSVTSVNTLSVSSTFPVNESYETSPYFFSNIKNLTGNRNLWSLRNSAYTNTDLSGSINAKTGTIFAIYDAYTGSNSSGVGSVIYSGCYSLNTGASDISFWMTHDNSFSTDLDSMYVVVSTDKGLNWTKVGNGYQRYSASASTPTWSQKTQSLSAYAGQTVLIGLLGVSKYGNVIGLDDIVVSSAPGVCTTPTAYNVSGGGSFCSGGSGVAVGLANSETGVTYQLMNGASTVSSPVSGTGSAITFGNQTAGTYTVVATRTTGGCTETMTGSAVVTVNPLPTITLGTIYSVSSSATSFDIPYTATTGNPDQFTISPRFPAVPSFATVADRNFSSSPINIAIPANTPANTYNFYFSVRNSTTGCGSDVVSVALTVAAATPTITTTGTLTAFTACAGTASAEQNFTVSGSNLTTNITVTPPTGFEVSTTSGSGFSPSVTLTQSSGTVATTTIYVRMATSSSSPSNGNVTCASTGATTQNVAVSGTVSGKANITLSTIPAINVGDMSFTIPYTAPTGSPTTYSITGLGITSVYNASLPSGSIMVNLSSAANASLIPFTLTVNNAAGCASNTILGGVKVTGGAITTIKIGKGSSLTVVLKSDSTLWAWGDGSNGQMGNGTNTIINTCAIQVGTSKDWVDVAVGSTHVLALKKNSTLWSWGNNFDGQLGQGNSGAGTNLNVPTQVGTATNWKSIATGYAYSMAIKTDGTLWTWGNNFSGQLGLGNSGSGTYRNTPMQVGTDTDWKMIVGGSSHTLAIKTDGTLWAWGSNSYSELGRGNTTSSSIPIQVGTSNNWTAIAAGLFHTLAIQSDGTLWSWGNNLNGQLGQGNSGTGTNLNIPTRVGTETSWKEISADYGSSSSLGLKTDNTLWSWGRNSSGQLGIGSTTNQSTPQQIAGTNWKAARAADAEVAALKTDDKLWAWGLNFRGGLGTGNTTQQKSPVAVECVPSITSFSPTSSCPGANIVISGSKFVGVTGVSIGGTAVSSFTVNNSTQITATVAPGTAAGTISVTNADGTGTSTNSFTIAIPSITLGSIASIPNTATMFAIPYTASVGAPNQFSISAGTTNALAGFSPIVNSFEFTNPMYVPIPANTANGTYNFDLTVRNFSNSCVSDVIPISLTVRNPTSAGINLKGNGNNIAAGSTAPSATNYTDFGSIKLADGTKLHNFLIENTGEAALTLSGTPIVSISGANASDFTVVSQPASTTVGGLATAHFEIRFDPSAAGLRTATVTIANNAASNSSYTFAIQGTGDATAILEQYPYMLPEIAPGLKVGEGSRSIGFTLVGAKVYFSTSLGQLWVTDGTTAGTTRVAGTNNMYNFNRLTNVNGNLYFTASSPSEIFERLFKYDGTDVTMIEINALYPTDLTNINGTLYFSAENATNYKKIYKLDGDLPVAISPPARSTGNFFSNLTYVNGILYFREGPTYSSDANLYKYEGTNLATLIAINPTEGSSSGVNNLTKVNNTLYFTASNDGTSQGLYSYDGTTPTLIAAGSYNSLTNFNGTLYFSGPVSGGSRLHKLDGSTITSIAPTITISSNINLTPIGSKIYYTAGLQTGPSTFSPVVLYSYDGTATEATLIMDSGGSPSPDRPVGANLTDLNGTLFFTANTVANGNELYKYDGTSATLIDINPTGSSNPVGLTNVNNTLYFSANNGTNGIELYKHNGTTLTLIDINPTSGSNPGDFTSINNTLYFNADNGINGIELWKSDGTTAGTQMVKDIAFSISSSNPLSNTIDVNGTLYFTASTPSTGTELFKFDGSTVSLVADLTVGSGSTFIENLININGVLYFRNSSSKLYKYDGTNLTDITPPNSGSSGNLTNVNGTLYFSAYTNANGSELYKFDGTSSTATLIDVISGSGNSSPRLLTNVNNTLYFNANSAANGTELYKYDGSTLTMIDVFEGSSTSNPEDLLDVNGVLYFTAQKGGGGRGLFKHDGTTLTFLTPGFSHVSSNYLYNINGVVYFVGTTAATGPELHKYDGNTITAIELIPGPTGADLSFGNTQSININGTFYFIATTPATGSELFKYDGSTLTPIDINPGQSSSNPSSFANINGTLYFSATGTNGMELYKYDGTNLTLLDIIPGSTGSFPTRLTNVNGTLYFNSYNVLNGTELWKSDGTVAGTKMVKDIQKGSDTSSPLYLTISNNKLFFSATYTPTDSTYGRELWALGNCTPTNMAVTSAGTNVSFNTEQQANPATQSCHCDVFNKLITTINATGASPVSGEVSSKVWIDASATDKYVQRHYEITPVNNPTTATGKVTLYFTQAEFDAFNALSNTDLPSSSSDDAGKENLLIKRYNGISSNGTGAESTYTSNATVIDPTDTDIVWNATANRWEVSFDAIGFGGYFVTTIVPIITSLSTNTVCEGENITITGSNLSGVTAVSIGGTAVAFTEVSASQITATVAVGTLSGVVSVTTPIGTAVSESSLTINPKPATPSITADNMTICKGGNVLLTGSCSTANASFRWTTPAFNSGNQTSALPSTNLRTITEPGTYKGLCESDKGCLSNEFSITINQATDCSGQNFITITPERPAICPGGSILMTATGCAGTLTWTSGTSSQTGASVTLSPAATTTYLVQCSTGGATTFALVVASNTLAVPVNVTTDKQRFKAVTTLTSDKKVGNATFTPGANVIYEAGNSITLLPGFTAEKWSTFTAEIKTCPQD